MIFYLRKWDSMNSRSQMLLTAWNIKISSGFIAKLWSPLVPLECEPQVPVLSPLRDRRMWFKKKHETKQKTIIGVFFHLPSVKLGSWSLLPLLSLFEGKGLSYYLQRTFIDFFFFTMRLYCPNGLSEGDCESSLLKLGIPPVLEGVGAQIFSSSFVCRCQ